VFKRTKCLQIHSAQCLLNYLLTVIHKLIQS